MGLNSEWRAYWSIDGGGTQNGTWTQQSLIAQVELSDAEAAAQPYTTFEGGLDTQQVGDNA
jgi:hypothetical protein